VPPLPIHHGDARAAISLAVPPLDRVRSGCRVSHCGRCGRPLSHPPMAVGWGRAGSSASRNPPLLQKSPTTALSRHSPPSSRTARGRSWLRPFPDRQQVWA
jgi:hypothetical protein